ncbi:phospholipase A [Enterovibrio nigricans]|uniref:Phospholipase A1 n=1 Tax=Enterovibrio nigricans DSM 22720 TaxID=1121868 RepID=A0A1T4VBM7_9GAMM|nr:phospholipase A [Enterovibrio nigricans]SKA62298.1 phospholipase A1 [Enterovibrio nigricans DSM 22720]
MIRAWTLPGLAALLSGAIFTSPALAEESKFSAHKDNYFLPFYKESYVNQARFAPLNPNGHAVKDTFIQFQLSVKYKLLSFDEDGLYVAYTQRSNWEAYDSSAYFRDDQYNPEIFYRLQFDPWQFSLGFEHQSNGAGGKVEVSWDRVYLDIQRDFEQGYVRLKPWVRVGAVNYNPNISDYLGYGEVELGWLPYNSHEIKLQLANMFTKDWNYGFYRLSWNFPLYQGLRGYMKAETGYGLTISNYNFDETAYGVGFAFSF